MQAWENFLAQQEKELGKETVRKWLRPLKVIRFDACNLYLEASDSFQALWFEEHIRHRLQTRFFNNNNKQIKVHLSILSRKQTEIKEDQRKKQLTTAPSFKFFLDELNPQFTWSNFIGDAQNLLPIKILSDLSGFDFESKKTLSPSGSVSFNPIYIYGKSGSGKTHLLTAIAAHLEKGNVKVLYTRAETFTEHVVNAIRSGEMQTFRKIYRNVDLLLIDDIEVFSRKSATQEELFHTFNTLHTDGKQIILSSCYSPQELKFIEPRLVSRFEWGITLQIFSLSETGLKEMVKNWSGQMNYPLTEKVLELLLENFSPNAKTLRKAFDALILRSHLNKQSNEQVHLPLNLAQAKSYLNDLILEKEKMVLTPGRIIQTVAEYFGIKLEDILSKSQNRECTLPRQIAMLLCRYHLKLPYTKIGDIFSRDHSTVITSIKNIQKFVETKDLEISSSINCINKKLI